MPYSKKLSKLKGHFAWPESRELIKILFMLEIVVCAFTNPHAYSFMVPIYYYHKYS